MAGYVALAAGAVIELTTGREVTYFSAAPGGLFARRLICSLLKVGSDEQPIALTNETLAPCISTGRRKSGVGRSYGQAGMDELVTSKSYHVRTV